MAETGVVLLLMPSYKIMMTRGILNFIVCNSVRCILFVNEIIVMFVDIVDKSNRTSQ